MLNRTPLIYHIIAKIPLNTFKSAFIWNLPFTLGSFINQMYMHTFALVIVHIVYMVVYVRSM